MSQPQPQPERPIELAIDIDQWKRDIHTFVDTTRQALTAITAELSSECSNSYLSSVGVQQADPSNPGRGFEANEGQESVRLAQLKSQLSQRITN